MRLESAPKLQIGVAFAQASASDILCRFDSNLQMTNPQPALFDSPPAAALRAAPVVDELRALAAGLGPRVYLGSSSWHFPGWAGLVWGREYSQATLSKRGLTAYCQHPLLRTVSLDRVFYRAIESSVYAGLAAQVPAEFRFVVKAPSMITDATLRDPASGKAVQPNPLFLDTALALDSFVRPAAQGLACKLGVGVFQLSPLPARWLRDLPGLFDRLAVMLAACRAELPEGSWLAVEVRDAELLTPEFAGLLKRLGVRYCLGLHDKMPSVEDQLPMLRALWPGPLVCRWNLQRGLRYEQAKGLFEPFDTLQAPDPATRAALAKVIAGTVNAGHPAFITINNKAEGSAPLSVLALARELLCRLSSGAGRSG